MIHLPSLSQTQQDLLEKPITEIEIQTAIKSLNLRKRPGVDGLSATYYKRFTSLLSPLMVDAFNLLLNDHYFCTESLPPSP